MSIASIEQLEGLDVGTRVVLMSRRDGESIWERAEGGLRKVGLSLTLPTEHFVGYLREGLARVEGTPNLQVGQVLAVGDFHIILCGRSEQGWKVVRLYVGNFHSCQVMTERQITSQGFAEVETPPPHMASLRQLGQLYWDQVDQNVALNARLAGQPTVPEDLVAALHAWQEANADGVMDDILDQFGIGRERDHDSRVRIWGTYAYTPDSDLVADSLLAGASDFDLEIDEVMACDVSWSKTVTVTNQGQGCTCDTIEAENLDQYVPRNADSWDFEVTCDV